MPDAVAKVLSHGDLLATIEHSQALSQQQKKLYLQMLHGVSEYGVDNDLELFTAVDFGFDLPFGPNQTHNIITVENYLVIMGEKVEATLSKNEAITVEIFAHNRPGLFLLTPDKTVYLLKESLNGTFVHYDPQKDAFIESSDLPIMGKEKLVIPNRCTFVQPDTYVSQETPDKFYHEQQKASKCAIHAAHAFLGFSIIDDTKASLMKLEQLTNDTYRGQIIEQLNRRGKKASDLTLLPQSQIAHFQKKARFELAQVADCHVELGNATAELLFILKQLAHEGSIDKKYTALQTYNVTIPASLVKYAKARQLYVTGQEWTEKLLERWLEAIEEDLCTSHEELVALDEAIAQFGDEPKLLPHDRYQAYIKLQLLRDPFTSLESNKEKIKMTLASLVCLQELFEKGDRLLVIAVNELHDFTLRKSPKGQWCLIDSLEQEQRHIQDPFSWLLKRQMAYFLANGHSCYEFISLPPAHDPLGKI